MSTPPPRRVERALANTDDTTLATLASNGDRDALDVLLRRHYDRVYRVCRRLCHNEADALDAAQDTLLAVARRIDRFDGRSAYTTWLYRVTTNTCLDELRRKQRRPIPTEILAENLDQRDSTAQVDQRLLLDAALAQLPDEFRAPVVLRDVAGLGYAEIAAVLNIPPGTVRSRIARGRGRLLAALGNQDGQAQRPTVRHPDNAEGIAQP